MHIQCACPDCSVCWTHTYILHYIVTVELFMCFKHKTIIIMFTVNVCSRFVPFEATERFSFIVHFLLFSPPWWFGWIRRCVVARPLHSATAISVSCEIRHICWHCHVSSRVCVLDRTFTFHYCIFYFTDIFVIILWYFIVVFVLHVYGICAARRTFCSFPLSSVLSSHHLRPDINTAFEWRGLLCQSRSVCVFVAVRA